MRRTGPGLVVLLALVLAGIPATVGAAPNGSKVAAPTVTGPVTGGQGHPSLVTTSYDLLAPYGYVVEEYFLDGNATSYQPAGKLGPDGKWSVKPNGTAPYKTRIVVFRPTDPTKFNGTVFVEWNNVSAGFDTTTDWIMAHTQMMRSGAAWIGVSAQQAGVQGGTEVLKGATAGGLKAGDPERYGTLSHPGDEYSYDIFSQAGLAAAGDAKGVKPLGDLKPKRVIAMGESQSAFRMVTYVNAVQPLTHQFDGFLIHSRGASGATLGKSLGARNADPNMPKTAIIRTDTSVPVLTFQTETDLIRLGFLPSRQADNKNFRLWEVAGASHADQYTGSLGAVDTGDGTAEQKLVDPSQASGGVLRCSQPINSGATFAVLEAAVSQLDRWVKDGTAPPKAPRMEATTTRKPAIVRDAHGIAKGGIRTPLVDAPLAANTGEPNAGGSFCSLFGQNTALGAATVAALYPTQADYVKKFDASADKAVKAGFMLQPEADNFKKAAANLKVGG